MKLDRGHTHINSIGGITCPELEDDVLMKSKLVVDSRKAALEEAPDIIRAIKNGTISPDDVYAELGELIIGRKPERINSREITVFRTVGIAAEDATTAKAIYELANKNNVGTNLTL
jgi:ornithine cyclodeaminase/alanine dehydrogenase